MATIRIIVQEQGSRQAAGNIRNIGAAASQTDRALSVLRRAFAAVTAVLGVRQYIELSNTYQTLQNRIRLVTSSTQEQVDVTRELLSVSNETFTSLRDTSELYARLAFNTRNLGLTQQQVLQVTRSLNQAVILSGAGVREASNAIIQFSQGLASGTLRGDELRSVLEQLPFVADVIARELEVDRSALRRLGAEGEITSERIVDALLNAGPEIQQEFQNITPTIGQAFNVLGNQITAAIGEFNLATGASDALAQSIISIAGGITDVADVAIAFFEVFNEYWEVAIDLVEEFYGVELGNVEIGFRDVLRFIAAGIDGITGVFTGLFREIRAFFIDAYNFIGSSVRQIINLVISVIEGGFNFITRGLNTVLRGLSTATGTVIDGFNEVATFFGGAAIENPFANAFEIPEFNVTRLNDEFQTVGEEFGSEFVAGFQGATGAQDFLSDVFNRADRRRAQREADGRDLGGQIRDPNEGQRLQTANDLLILQLREQLDIESRLETLRGTGTDLQIEQAEALERLNKKITDDKITLNDEQREEIELLVRSNAERKVRNELDREISDFTQDLEDQLRLLELSTTEREIEADLLPIINSAKQAGLELDQMQIDALRTLREELQQRVVEEQVLNTVFGDRAALLAEVEATQRLLDAEEDPNRRRGLERAQAEQRIAGRQGDPSLVAGFENGLDQIFLKVSDVAGGIEQALVGAFTSAEDALVEFVQTGEFNFSGLVDSILADLTRLLAQQAILALFNAVSGGTSGAFGGVLGALAGRQSGGPVSAGEPYLVGERGPEIFAPGQSGTIIPNGSLPAAAPQTNVTVVNVMDPAMVSAALNDPQNQQVIVNVIGRNRQAVNRQLGNA